MIIYSPTFTGSVQITGSQTVTGDLTVQGNLTAQTFILSSSVSYFTESFASGSTRFGDSMDDTMVVTGSLRLTGSVGVNTTAPAYSLDARGPYVASGMLSVRSTDTATIDFGGVLGFGGFHNGSSNQSQWATIKGAKENSNVNDNASYLSFGTQISAGSITERMRITSAGNVGIGTTTVVQPSSGATTLRIKSTVTTKAGSIVLDSSDSSVSCYIYPDNTNGLSINTETAHPIVFRTTNIDRMRVTAGGAVNIGMASNDYAIVAIKSNSTSAFAGFNVYATGNGNFTFMNHDNNVGWVGTEFATGGTGQTPLGFLVGGSERMRITTGGSVLIGCTVEPDGSTNGIGLYPNGEIDISRSGGTSGIFNRNTNDGAIIDLRQDNNVEGTISVSGTTVSYNSFLGSHWSQLQDGSRIEILKGTILEAIDEMCIWEDEINDRLPKSKISDTIESKNVYGIFLDWDNDWESTNDFYVAAVGLGYIRINANETIEIGDLLQSNGDGTAKVQSDDIMRSSTIAKVVLTNKIETYEDGSYLIAATLHCG
jgi:hypothetical protein